MNYEKAEYSYVETINFLKKEDKPSVDKLTDWYIGKGFRKFKAKTIAKNYRYIISMLNNVNQYNNK